MIRAVGIPFLLAGLIYGGLVTVGFGVKNILQLFGTQVRIPAAIFGAVLIQIVSWQSYESGTRGIGTRIFVPLGLFSGLSIFALMRTKKFVSRIAITTFHNCVPYIVGTFFTSLAFLYQWWPLLRTNGAPISGPNGDVASYAQVSEHLLRFGFADSGKIIGANLGHVARNDVFGAYALLAVASEVTRVRVEILLLPSLLLGFVLLAHAITNLLLPLVKVSGGVVGCIVGFVQSVAMMGYLGGNYFFSQLLGMGFAVALLAQLFASRFRTLKLGILFATLVALALILAGGFLTYPQMLIVIPFLLVPATFEKGCIRDVIIRVLLLATSLTMGALIVFDAAVIAIRRTIALARDATNGWPLPPLVPSELLGLQVIDDRQPIWVNIVQSMIVVVLLAFAGLVLARKGCWGEIQFAFVLVTVILTSYSLVYLRSGGPSYQQWKWITFLLPLFVISVLTVMAVAVREYSPRRSRLPTACFVVCLLLFGALNLSRNKSWYSVVADSAPVTDGVSGLSQAPELVGLSEINVSTGPYLASMWPSFFVNASRISIIDPSYYSSIPILDAVTLMRADDERATTSPASTRVGDSFALVPPPPAEVLLSSDPLSLSAQVALDSSWPTGSPGEMISADFSVTNTGSAAWTSYGPARGSVHIGVRIYSLAGDLISDAGRAATRTFPGYVAPGETIFGTVTFSVPRPGEYVVVVTPVSEQVAWFNDLRDTYAAQRLLKVN